MSSRARPLLMVSSSPPGSRRSSPGEDCITPTEEDKTFALVSGSETIAKEDTSYLLEEEDAVLTQLTFDLAGCKPDKKPKSIRKQSSLEAPSLPTLEEGEEKEEDMAYRPAGAVPAVGPGMSLGSRTVVQQPNGHPRPPTTHPVIQIKSQPVMASNGAVGQPPGAPKPQYATVQEAMRAAKAKQAVQAQGQPQGAPPQQTAVRVIQIPPRPTAPANQAQVGQPFNINVQIPGNQQFAIQQPVLTQQAVARQPAVQVHAAAASQANPMVVSQQQRQQTVIQSPQQTTVKVVEQTHIKSVHTQPAHQPVQAAASTLTTPVYQSPITMTTAHESEMIQPEIRQRVQAGPPQSVFPGAISVAPPAAARRSPIRSLMASANSAAPAAPTAETTVLAVHTPGVLTPTGELNINLQAILNNLNDLPLHDLIYFLALVFGMAFIAMSMGMSPTWMVVLIALASFVLFHKLKI